MLLYYIEILLYLYRFIGGLRLASLFLIEDFKCISCLYWLDIRWRATAGFTVLYGEHVVQIEYLYRTLYYL